MLVLFMTFLHVTVMFFAVALSLGSAVLIRVAGRTRRARSIQGVAEIAASFGNYLGPIFVLGGLLGLATAIVSGLNLLTPWLVIAYVLFALGAGTGALGEGKWTAEVARAAAANPEPEAGPALVALLTSTRGNIVFGAFASFVVLLIFDMVLKPFS